MKSGFSNWSDVRIFLAVYREGSTQAASRRLGIAQPTVARRIDALEHVLRLTLFERDTRGFHPTEDARAILSAAQEAERAMEGLAREAQNRWRASADIIRVTAAGPFIDELLSEVFQTFAEQHGKVRFDYFASGDMVDLEAGEADIALRAIDEPTGRETLCRRLPDYGYGIFCSVGYAERFGIPECAEELSTHSVVGYSGPLARTRAYGWVRDKVPDDRIVSHCNNQAAACRLIKSDIAVGLVTNIFAHKEPGLIRCFSLPADLSGRLWLMVSPAAKERRLVRKLVDYSYDKIAERIKHRDLWPPA